MKRALLCLLLAGCCREEERLVRIYGIGSQGLEPIGGVDSTGIIRRIWRDSNGRLVCSRSTELPDWTKIPENAIATDAQGYVLCGKDPL